MHNKLLDWYDVYRRNLPWRAKKGESPNPYYVYLSEILLQQTTVPTVLDYFDRFIQKWPTLKDLGCAELEDILKTFQGLGYYSRAKNLALSARLLSEQHSFPKTDAELIKFPGIGDYTSKAIASIAFDQPVVPVDGNVIRVFSRYYGLTKSLPLLKNDVKEKAINIGAGNRPGDFAQALMDLGSMICKPKSALCDECPIQKDCFAKKEHMVQVLPYPKVKIEKPKKNATVFVYHSPDHIFIIKNPSNGLLSNLWGFPTSEWVIDNNDFTKSEKMIRHTFTHFYLTLVLQEMPLDELQYNCDSLNEKIILKKDLSHFPISTLMRKVIKKL